MRTDQIRQLYSRTGPFASVFADVSRDSANGDQEVELRAREVCERLTAQGAPDSAVRLIGARLTANPDEPAPLSRAVVADADGVLFDELTRVRTEQPTAAWSDLPDVGTWLTHEDSTIGFVLAVVDHEGGDIATYRSHAFGPDELESAGEQAEHEHKTRGGGLAHRRYQRTAENSWAENAERVAQEISGQVAGGHRLVLLAGEPESRSDVADRLPDRADLEVVERDHGGRARDGGDEALHGAVQDVLVRHAASRQFERAHELQEMLDRGTGAVTGIAAVAEAFAEGRVRTLLIDLAATADVELAPADHPGFAAVAGPDGPIRADLALVAAAGRTGADVVALPTRALSGAPAAALIRWDEP